MRHITYGDKSFFLDDDSTETLLTYLRALSEADRSDVVRLNGISSEGTEVEVSMFLNANTVLAGETTSAHLLGPENARGIEYMQRKLDLLEHPRSVQPGSDPSSGADGS